MVAGKHNAPTCVAFLRFLFSATLKGKKKGAGHVCYTKLNYYLCSGKGQTPVTH